MISSRAHMEVPAASWFSETPAIDVTQWRASLQATWHTADWWFEALDQRSVSVGAERLTLQVVGIHGEGAHLWIQLECADSVRTGVLRVFAGMRMADAFAAIAAMFSGGRD